jgi:hypothetical protein
MAAADTKFAMVLSRLAVIGYSARDLNWSRSSRWCLVVNLIREPALAGMREQYHWLGVARRDYASLFSAS